MSSACLPTSVALLVLLLPPAAARAQETLLEWSGATGDFTLGSSLTGCGDVDGDRVRDVVAAEYAHGEVRWYSGADGRLIRFATVRGQLFVHAVGDVNRDGIEDVVAVQWGSGRLPVLSGADASELYALTGDPYLGADVLGLGDVDGDGAADFAVTRPYVDATDPNNPGHVSVHSGGDGSLLYDLAGVKPYDGFGYSVAPLGDRDGDGVVDFAVGVPTTTQGYVDLRSGATGAALGTLPFTNRSYTGFASHMVATTDRDGDGWRDLVVREIPIDADTDPYRLAILSSATGSELAHVDAPVGWTAFGHSLANGGDLDGDGVEDLLATIFYDRLEVYSGATNLLLYSFETGDRDVHLGGFGPAGDLDGDGRGDVVRASYDSRNPVGTITLSSGNDLFLDATPTVAFARDHVSRTLRTGVPGNLSLLVLTEVNGSSIWRPLGPLVPFDATGTVDSSFDTPAGLAGYVLGFRGFAINARGRVAASGLERIEFR
ncbi:MAG TPA: VCBS repeat-containing protein [Planctomycetota bacterium]|nr:VCBS repeat-containing protein [Planctomycetota bacterium]